MQQRLMFTIVSARTGWQLYEGNEGRQWFASRGDAMETADLMAASLHAHHGIPTAVIQRLASDAAVNQMAVLKFYERIGFIESLSEKKERQSQKVRDTILMFKDLYQ